MHFALLSCVLLLAAVCGCRSGSEGESPRSGPETPWHQKEVTLRGVLRAPGSSTVAAPVAEWVVELPDEENKPVPVDISRVRDRAIELEGKKVKVTARTPAPSDADVAPAPLVVKSLEAQ